MKRVKIPSVEIKKQVYTTLPAIYYFSIGSVRYPVNEFQKP